MNKEHYNLIIEKTKIFIGKIDGDDVNEIVSIINNWDFTQDEYDSYDNLISDLNSMVNAMWCEHGLDYGITQKWNDTTKKILDVFNNGYSQNETDLNQLIQLICDGIEIKDDNLLFNKTILYNAVDKKSEYVIGIDSVNGDINTYILYRLVDGVAEILLSKKMINKNQFLCEIGNISEYFNAEIIKTN